MICSIHTNRQWFIPVSKTCRKLGNDVCRNLPAAHALTGCDSTSSLYKVGKRSVYTKLLSNNTNLANLCMIGLSDEAVNVAKIFILILYGNKKMENIAKHWMNFGMCWHRPQISRLQVFPLLKMLSSSM